MEKGTESIALYSHMIAWPAEIQVVNPYSHRRRKRLETWTLFLVLVCLLVVYFANWLETQWVSAVKSVCLSFRGLFLFDILQLLSELFGFNQGDIVEDKSTFLPPVGPLHSHIWHKSCHDTKLYKPQLRLSCRSYLEIQYWFVSSLVLLSKFQNSTLLNVHN